MNAASNSGFADLVATQQRHRTSVCAPHTAAHAIICRYGSLPYHPSHRAFNVVGEAAGRRTRLIKTWTTEEDAISHLKEAGERFGKEISKRAGC
jgi:hypothetical protein